jgi:ABC-type nitrate/sulfonate/bicarbonate transport system substrate-binding protein
MYCKRVIKTSIVLAIIVFPVLAQAQLKKVPIAFSSIAVVQSGIWVTKEARLFEKYGLNADLVYVASGTTVSQAMVSGEFLAGLVGGAIVTANVSGADFAIVGGVVNRPNFYLTAHPSIKKPTDLRGKAVGITRYGSSTDFIIRFLLQKWGMEPDREVKILQMGGQPEILAGMKAGVVQAGVTGSPTEFMARKAGFTVLQDMGKIGLEYPINSIVTTRSFIRKDPKTVRSLLMAYTEGVHRLFKDKAFAKGVFSKYMRVYDQEILDSTYDYAKDFIERIPNPPYKGLATFLGQSNGNRAKAKCAWFRIADSSPTNRELHWIRASRQSHDHRWQYWED